MAASLLLSWQEGVSAEVGEAGAIRVRGPNSGIILRRLAPAIAAAVGRLAPAGEDEDRLAEQIQDAGGAEALAGWYYCLQGLARRGLVCRAVHAEGRRLAVQLPTSSSFAFTPVVIDPDRAYRLSRFAYLRREGDGLVLESPLAHARIVVDDARLAGLVGALARPATARDLAERMSDLPSEAVAPLLGLLAGAGLVQAVVGDGEEEALSLRSWEFHDLLFHARSREGRSDAPFGATYRFVGRLEPPPALKPAGDGESCELYRPDLERLRRDDPPFEEILERRRSLREYAERPITSRQLGEFLYRIARVKECGEAEVDAPHGPLRMEFATRPYPSGGGLYELEFYAVVRVCDGLAPGLYHYDGRGHRLERMHGNAAEVELLLSDAATSTGVPRDRLQVLVILTARFQRLAWKYASIAYALILKHGGVVYQTMYLAATAMGLAPCAIGGGDSDLFARAAGTDYYTETSVGEFLLGSAKHGT